MFQGWKDVVGRGRRFLPLRPSGILFQTVSHLAKRSLHQWGFSGRTIRSPPHYMLEITDVRSLLGSPGCISLSRRAAICELVPSSVQRQAQRIEIQRRKEELEALSQVNYGQLGQPSHLDG